MRDLFSSTLLEALDKGTEAFEEMEAEEVESIVNALPMSAFASCVSLACALIKAGVNVDIETPNKSSGRFYYSDGEYFIESRNAIMRLVGPIVSDFRQFVRNQGDLFHA